MTVRQTVRLALRNLARHRRRTLITASAVAGGLAIFILMDSILVGAEIESDRNIIWYETGAAQVVHREYLNERDERPLGHVVEQRTSLEEELRQAGFAVTARTVFNAEMIVFRDPFPEDGSIHVTAYGIDPRQDDEVFRVSNAVSSGRFLEPDDEGILLGSWLAEDIGAQVGYPVMLVTRTRDGFFQTMDLEVVGIVSTPNPIINRSAVYLPLAVVDEYLQMDGGVTEIAVAGTTTAGADRPLEEVTRAMAAVAGTNPDLAVVSWRELAADYIALTQTKDSASGIILFLVFVIAAVGISNTILMAVLERTRELGMLQAIGMRNGEITVMLLAEAAGIGLLGALLGITGGAALNVLLVNYGIDYGFLMREADMGYRLTSHFYGTWNLPTFARAAFMGVIISIITAMSPVRRALKRPVVESLRGNS